MLTAVLISLVLGRHRRQILVHHPIGLADRAHRASLQPHRPVAQRLDVARRMRYEHNRSSARFQLVHLAHAALPEIHIAHRQRLVHQQNLRFHVNRDGEGQPHRHAARVRLHRLIDEAADLGERFDPREALLHFFFRKPQDRAVQEHVVASGKFRIEARAQLEQRGHAPPRVYDARRRLQDPRANLQQRALPRTVLAHDAECFPLPDLEGNLAQRPKIGVKLPPPERRDLLQPVARRRVDRITLRNPLELNRLRH